MKPEITSELAKKLKDVGFNEFCLYFYNKNGLQQSHLENGSSTDCDFRVEVEDLLENWNCSNGVWSAPFIFQVTEWLRKNHGIWILVLPQDKSVVDFRDDSEFPYHALFFSVVKYDMDGSYKELINSSDDNGGFFMHYDDYDEAYLAAIEFVITKIINQ